MRTATRRTTPESVSREQREAILAAHMPQVEFLARKIHRRLPAHVPLEDLVNEGLLGLMDALEKYDPGRHVQFKSYAQFRIQGAILDSLRNLDWCSREVRKEARRIEQVEEQLTNCLGRSVTQEEVAARAGLSHTAYLRLLGEIRSAEVVSLQALVPENTDQPEPHFDPVDTGEDPFEACVRSEMREKLALALSRLPERDRQMLALYYYEELTLREIGEVFGIGESRVCQLHSAAIARLGVELRALLLVEANGIRPAPVRARKAVA
jgi:RNA polymerase sigma factor for flagellar operon FliA